MANKITGYIHKIKLTYVKTTLFTLFVCALFTKGYAGYEKTGNNYFPIFINGSEIGVTDSAQRAEELLIAARRNVVSESGSEELTFIEAEMTLDGQEVLFGKLDREETILANMEALLRRNIRKTLHRSYTVKVNEYMVSLASMEDAKALLQAAVDKYDTEGKFTVNLCQDSGREFNVLTAAVVEARQAKDESEAHLQGGVQAVLFAASRNVETTQEKDFSDYDLGLKDIRFSEQVEIMEAYLPETQITSLETAVNEVIKEQEMPGVYEIVPGDTLTGIAIKVKIPMEKIIEMNSDTLKDENSTIHAGDKLIITVPQPELSVERVEEKYYEENYDLPTIYVDNNNWYNFQTKVLKPPSSGFRKIVADVYYVNDKEISREILKEEIVKEAVAKVVERGTKIPLTYIKPIAGGIPSSGFGYRPRPNVAGATSDHRAQDWAVPTGTTVMASCSGTVTKAGWGGSYGYVVFIDHADGSQTRYAHLSRVLVKVGQKVKQGEKIALSGNTGASTGPHVHFEILINGVQVNPLKHL